MPLSRQIERILIVLIGGFAIYLGYRLFHLATEKQGEFSLSKGEDFKLSLANVAPGIYFAIFGSIILFTAMINNVTTSDTVTTTTGTPGTAQSLAVQITPHANEPCATTLPPRPSDRSATVASERQMELAAHAKVKSPLSVQQITVTHVVQGSGGDALMPRTTWTAEDPRDPSIGVLLWYEDLAKLSKESSTRKEREQSTKFAAGSPLIPSQVVTTITGELDPIVPDRYRGIFDSSHTPDELIEALDTLKHSQLLKSSDSSGGEISGTDDPIVLASRPYAKTLPPPPHGDGLILSNDHPVNVTIWSPLSESGVPPDTEIATWYADYASFLRTVDLAPPNSLFMKKSAFYPPTALLQMKKDLNFSLTDAGLRNAVESARTMDDLFKTLDSYLTSAEKN